MNSNVPALAELLKLASYGSWVGFDFDGTLAESNPGDFDPAATGAAVPEMLDKLREHLAAGDTVKIFTARAAGDAEGVGAIQEWLEDHDLPALEITNEKDPGMTKLYDDRAVSVGENTGVMKEAAEDCPCAKGADRSSPSNTYICRCYGNPMIKSVGFLKNASCDVQEALDGSDIPGDVVFYSDGKARATVCMGDWHDSDDWELALQFGHANWEDFEDPDDSEIGKPDWATCSHSNQDFSKEAAVYYNFARLRSESRKAAALRDADSDAVSRAAFAGVAVPPELRRAATDDLWQRRLDAMPKEAAIAQGDLKYWGEVQDAVAKAVEDGVDPSSVGVIGSCGHSIRQGPNPVEIGKECFICKQANEVVKAGSLRSIVLTGNAYKTPTTQPVSEKPRFVTFSELRRIALTGETDLSKLAAITNIGRDQEIEEETGPDDLKAALRKARKDTDAHATQEERDAGNYKKGRFNIRGLHIAIENPANSIRSGKDGSGNPWRSVLSRDYGYFTRGGQSAAPIAVDGDEIDVFIGPNLESDLVVVIDQYFGKKFDESKFVICCTDKKHGEDIYLANYQSGWKLGPVSTCTIQQLVEWLKDGDHTKPFKGQMVKAAGIGIISP